MPQYALGSRKGRKHIENEDAVDILRLDDDSYLMMVADGIGSHRLGGSVARWFVARLQEVGHRLHTHSLDDILRELTADFRDAFDDLQQMLESGASVSVAHVRKQRAEIAWAGDSPIFHANGSGGEVRTTRVSTLDHNELGHLTNYFSGEHSTTFHRLALSLPPPVTCSSWPPTESLSIP